MRDEIYESFASIPFLFCQRGNERVRSFAIYSYQKRPPTAVEINLFFAHMATQIFIQIAFVSHATLKLKSHPCTIVLCESKLCSGHNMHAALGFI